jgi:hypothetical protein
MNSHPLSRISISLYTIVAIILSLMACKSTEQIRTTWAHSDIKVDGNISDWQDMPGVLFFDQNASVAIGNDNDNLHILFKTTDVRWARAIKKTGITLYFDPKGGTSKDFFIHFKHGPSLQTLREMSGAPDGYAHDESSQSRDRFGAMAADQPPSLTCYIKDRIVEKPIPPDGGEGPAAAFDSSHGFYAYEFSVPLSEGRVRYYGLGIEPGDKLSIGAEWGDVGDMMRKMGGDSGGMVGRGGGMPGGGKGGRGGMPGGGKGGRGGGQREQPEKQEIWLQTSLATLANPTH